jgi:hypothetical protein
LAGEWHLSRKNDRLLFLHFGTRFGWTLRLLFPPLGNQQLNSLSISAQLNAQTNSRFQKGVLEFAEPRLCSGNEGQCSSDPSKAF